MSERQFVCVVDDDEMVRQSICMLLASLGVAVVSYPDALAFLDDPDIRKYDCLVTDVRMPGISGLELQDRLRLLGIQIPVIFISGHGDVPMAVQAMRNGALDFLLKPFNHQALVDKVQLALVRCKELRRHLESALAVQARLETLSRREREVLKMVIAGKINKVMAAELGISPKTVECHRANIMEKMNVSNLAELVQQMARYAT